MSDKIHPVTALFPMMADDELADLAADIKTRGLLYPIVRDSDGQILDGRNRLEACRRAGIAPAFEDYTGDDPIGYCLAVNLDRRHMTQGQRAMVAAKTVALFATNNIQTQIATSVGVSRPRIAYAQVVLRYTPDAAGQVIAGTLPLDDAYAAAQNVKKAADSAESQMKALREEAPDLAGLVDAGTMTLAEALGAARERKEADKRRRQVTTTNILKAVLLLEQPATEEHIAYTAGYVDDEYVPAPHSPITPERLRVVAAFTTALANKLEELRDQANA